MSDSTPFAHPPESSMPLTLPSCRDTTSKDSTDAEIRCIATETIWQASSVLGLDKHALNRIAKRDAHPIEELASEQSKEASCINHLCVFPCFAHSHSIYLKSHPTPYTKGPCCNGMPQHYSLLCKDQQSKVILNTGFEKSSHPCC